MKQKLIFILLSIFVISLSSQELNQPLIPVVEQVPVDTEYMYIKPLSIEKAPVVKIVESAPLDSDNDGVIDNSDKCPNTVDGNKVDKDGCKILNDSDNDGITDEDDECPQTPQGIETNERGCELDSDADGILDSKDKCPNTSNNFEVDGYGCPQTATLQVNFPPSQFNVDEKLISQLEDFAMFLRNNPGYDVIIYGYTDSSGNAKSNKQLSQRRADAIKEALTRYSISSIRLTAIGKGEEYPIADNDTKEGRAKNRRIEVELVQQ